MSRNIFDDAYYARGGSPFDPTVNDLEPDPSVVTDALLNDGLISPITVWSSLKTREELDLVLAAIGLTDGTRGGVIVSTTCSLWTIAPGAVSLTKLADIATGSLGTA